MPPSGRHLRSESWWAVYITRCSKYVESSDEKWTFDSSPSRAFMDGITIFVRSKIAADGLLQRYYDLFTWARMKAKPKKSRSQSLVSGSVREIHFEIGGDKIPTVREKPGKSLGHLYSIPLTYRQRCTEVQKVALKGLRSIDKTCLPGKMKAWCHQNGLLPCLLCPLQMYEIALSCVEWIQQYSNKYLRRWLGVPPCFSKVGWYTTVGKLTAPNVFTGRRIQNWESTPSHDDEGVSLRDHLEGVSRNKISYEVVGC